MNRELQSPLLAFFVVWTRKENLVGVGTAGLAGWEVEETQRWFVRHLPIAFLALWQWGQEGTGPVAGRVAAGESRGPVLRRGCQSAVRWGGDAQPCVQFPTGLAIRHRRCELPGMTYFPCARAALARRGSGGAAGSSPPRGRHPLLRQGASQGILA